MLVGILIVLGVIVLYVWSLYNQLVTIKTRIQASIQEIGNQLKRQADLIPNLTAAVKGYFKQEKEIFALITEARRVVLEALKEANAKN
jgi:Uncharacterized conserved protein